MNIFLSNNISRSLSIAILCIAYGLLQALAFRELVSIPFFTLALDGVVGALFFFGLSFLLWKAVKYGNFDSLEKHQRLLNYIALGLLMVATWVAMNYLSSSFIFIDNHRSEAVAMVPMKAFIGFLAYLLIVQTFQIRLSHKRTPELADEEAEEVCTKSESFDIEQEIEELERVVVKTGQRIHVILVPEIVYFQAEGDYVRIFTDTDKYLKEDTMKYFQSHLPQQQFVRVHRSYLVNITKILRVELYEKQNHQLTLSNGDKLKISASGYKRLREALQL